MKIICPKCNRILENPDWNPQDTCKDCGSRFIPLNNQGSNLGNQFQQIGQEFSNIRQNIPHLYVGKQEINTQNPMIQKKVNSTPLKTPQNAYVSGSNPYINPDLTPKLDFYDKLRKWGILFLISVVIVYAGYRVILSFL